MESDSENANSDSERNSDEEMEYEVDASEEDDDDENSNNEDEEIESEDEELESEDEELESEDEELESEDEENNSECDEEDYEEEEKESGEVEAESEEEKGEEITKKKRDVKRKVKLDDCIEELYTGGIDNIEEILSGKPLENFDIYDEKTLNFEKNETFFKNCNKKWGWKEELQLLEYVEDCGLFNWGGIANRLTHHNGSKFESWEVQDHFNKYYLKGTLGQIWNYRLVEKPVLHFDHTEDDPVDEGATSKYLPCVAAKDLKTIKFLPHREEFEVYPPSELPMDPEMIVLKLDFSSYYMNHLKNLKLHDEVRHLQLAIVDSYRRTVSERIAMHKFMKDYNLIEQFFYKVSQPAYLEYNEKKLSACDLEKEFQKMQKFIPLFNSSAEFLDFYFGCIKEELLKLEIARLSKLLKARKIKEKVDIPRSLEMKTLLGKKAPACYSILTKLLYYTGQGGKKENLNSPEENVVNNDIKWLNSHMILKEGLLLKQIQVTKKDMRVNPRFIPNDEISLCQSLQKAVLEKNIICIDVKTHNEILQE